MKTMNEPKPIRETTLKLGERPLSNAEAKTIAEKIFYELAAEFAGNGIFKVIKNLNRIEHRERKNRQVDWQIGGAEYE